MTLAVLELRAGIKISGRDVYVATVGGMKISEPSADLAVALSVATQMLFTQLMPVLAIVSLMVLVSALSSSILPPAGMLVILAALMGTVIYLLRKQLMKIHTKLQIALTESFKENSQTPQP
jgi:hypothetical protein